MEQDEVGYSYYSTPNEILSYGVSIEDFHNIYASVYAITYDDWQFDETTSHENEGKTYIDVKIAYHWELKDGVLFKPYVSVENLTDEKYYVIQLDEGIAWHVGGSLRVNF